MKKRLSALILAMLMILSICPIAMAEDAAVSTASAYDVHIKGNFYDGETLTAHYTPYSSDGCEIDETKTVYTWYYKNINLISYDSVTVTKLEEKTGDNTFVIPTEICEKSYFNAMKNIFVTVTTADANGNYGEPVASGMYGYPVCDATDYRNKQNKAILAHIIPKGADGSMEVGDTLVARYTYISASKVAEGNTYYTWYRKDTPDGTGTQIQNSTSAEYTLTNADIGKWIECTVTPFDVKGTKYTRTSTAKIHFGNLGFLSSVTSSYTNFTALTCADTGYTHPVHKLLNDGTDLNSVGGLNIVTGSFVNSSTYLEKGELKYNLGSVMPLDGVYFDLNDIGATIKSYSIQYSVDDKIWYDIYSTTEAAPVTAEFVLPKTVKAQYVRFYTPDAHYRARIRDFYPIQKQDAKVTVPESVGTIENGVITVKEFNKSSAALLSEITATSLIDDSALATPIYVDAEGNQINEEFAINSNTTAKLQVTGKNGVAIEYGLNYEKIEEVLTVNCTPGVAYLEEGKIYVDTWKTSSADLVNAVSATSVVNGGVITPVIVDGEGNTLEPFEIDETTTDKYVRFTNIYGDSYDYEIAYKHLVSNSMQYVGKASYVWNTVDFSKYNKEVIYQEAPVTIPTGKYILKSELNVPDGYTISLQARQGTSAQGGWISGILKFDDATKTIIASDTDTGFKYVPGKTYTIEYLIDYDDLKLSNLYEVYTEIRIDGFAIAGGIRNIQRAATVGLMSPYFAATKTNEAAADQHIKATNSSFRKVKSRDAFAVTTNNYALNLKSGNAIVTDIEPDVEYTLENTMGIYKGTGFDTYVAIYSVKEDSLVLESAAINPETVTIGKDQVAKAFCLTKKTLIPLLINGEWK